MSRELARAIRMHDATLVKRLSGSDLTLRDEDGQSLLHEAVAYDNLQAAVELVQRGIDVNAADKNGQTPLHYCGIHQRAEIADVILTHGGDCRLRPRTGPLSRSGCKAVAESLVREWAVRGCLIRGTVIAAGRAAELG
jgi:ankyrin repeat protein